MTHTFELFVAGFSIVLFAYVRSGFSEGLGSVERWRARRAEERRIRLEDEARAVADRRGYR